MRTAELEALAGFALGPLVCFHGGDKDVIERVYNGLDKLGKSSNQNDWLGNGVYFWVGSKERAQEWANQKQSSGLLREVAVLGAIIYPEHRKNMVTIHDFFHIDIQSFKPEPQRFFWIYDTAGSLRGRKEVNHINNVPQRFLLKGACPPQKLLN